MTVQDIRPTVEAPDDDPHIWLEEIDGSKPLEWVEKQSAATLQRFGGQQFEHDRDTLTDILNRPDKIPMVGRRGDYLYNVWQDAQNPRGLWRRTKMASYKTAAPEWELLLDIDALAKSENDDWIWAGAQIEPEKRQRAIIGLSRGGSDAVVNREFDLETLCFIDNGFNLPEAKGGLGWLDLDTVLISSALGEGMATQSGYARTVRLWQRGTDPLAAPVIFECGPESMAVGVDIDHSSGNERLWFVERHAFFETTGWLGDRSGPKQRVEVPATAWWNSYNLWFTVKPREDWTIAGVTYPADTLLGISLQAFLAGDRDFQVLFEPAARRALQGFFWNDQKLVISYLDNLAPRFEIFEPTEGEWVKTPISALPTEGIVHIWSLDVEHNHTNGELLVAAQDPITPPQVLLLDIARPKAIAAPKLLKQSPALFDVTSLVVTRHEAISSDGESIPYTQIGPKRETGDAPVYMTGYGGFGLSMEPYYSASIGKLWLERGGTSVVANLRGGGEFGTAWHEAGRRAGKKLSHDDFAAVAADLVRRGVTRADRIGAEGGSNGGLLISNMLTRYPERFGALFCTIPLIDMRRYSKLLAGASWIDEYGDPDKVEDWAFLKELSAYHNALPGRPYPPILIATTRRDDRVHPGHARKMAEKLQGLGYNAYFYEPEAGGHGYGKDNKERASFIALGYAFLRDAIGWEPAL
ncbi:prolyl oligopeptidase family serine peptidase [Phyllobacterium myrsinacearum]|uniref:Prolyl oligopeptidase n=1 Tax=Phyllobacterium myrsinacearum TaxID=28101 RepID=A0A839ERC4_9HYPH|nr:prolyl oligopeptidase family serine peptidase [Phyllobacterium myrsinacearum]MBA8880768.1 prolyl oligopeptidase [Phyllobacterium myrsinacearum]